MSTFEELVADLLFYGALAIGGYCLVRLWWWNEKRIAFLRRRMKISEARIRDLEELKQELEKARDR